MRRYTLKEVHRPISSKVDFRKDLNPEQYKVVTEADGPSLVLAGAGSGKTRTLIYRVAYLLEKGIHPQSILLVTFTNKAAKLMKDRVEILLKAKPKGLWSGTFHHVGNRCLRMHAKALGIKDDFGILDREDSRDLVKVCIKDLNIKTKFAHFPKAAVVEAIISYARNSKSSIENVVSERFPYFAELAGYINKVHRIYTERKRRSNNLDYDDLLTEWIRLLKEHPEVRRKFCRQFRYILVDEYQDTNRLQFDIIRLLSDSGGNILVVGDDAQSIYSFRAAEIRNILDFPKRFSGTKIYRLETNYRSTPQILTLANHSIEHNREQFKKELKAVRRNGPLPVLVRPRDSYATANFISQRILELKEEGIPLNEIAVLYRAHYQSAQLEMELVKRGIPHVVRGGIKFFEQAHIKDVLAHLKILQNPMDELSWIRLLCLYPGIGTASAVKIFKDFADSGFSFKTFTSKKFSPALSARTADGLKQFKVVCKKISKEGLISRPDELIELVVETGYGDYVRDNFTNAQDRLDDLEQLANFAHRYKSVKEFVTDVSQREPFKGETIIGWEDKDEHLVLSTIHQAKGLEWSAVFIIGLIEGQFPHPKSIDHPEHLEEERRLFYVAVTRTENQLYLLSPCLRFDHSYGEVICRPSLFLKELPLHSYESWELEEEKVIQLE